MKRILTVLLALVMLLSCIGLASCKKKSNDTTTPEPTSGTVATLAPGEDDEFNVPDDLGYEGEFKVLLYETSNKEYCTTLDGNTDAIDSALWQRDQYITDYVGVDMVYDVQPGHYEKRHEFQSLVMESILGNQATWDLIGGYSMIPPNLASLGVLVDMNTLDYTDFNKAWYPRFMVDSCTINDKTYFITGDASINTLFRMQGVVFSAKQAVDNGISEYDLYNMVYDGDWTLDAWLTMCKDLSRNEDDTWDQNDFYAIGIPNYTWVDSFYFSSGLTMISENDSNTLEVSADINGDAAMAIFNKLNEYTNVHHTIGYVAGERAINKGQCIFVVTTMESFRTYYVEATETYRVLPFPKYEAGTETDYQTTLGYGHVQYCISEDIADPDRASAVLQTMGYAGYTLVTPEVFENSMKLKYSDSNDVAKMFDIMRDGRNYDVSSLFYMTFGANGYKNISTMFRMAYVDGITNYTSNYKNNFEAGAVAVTNLLNRVYAGS